MGKRYKLLKDIDSPLLKAKAGEIGVLKESNKIWFDDFRYFYFYSQVTDLTDWFELIPDTPEQTTKEGFVWSDKMANDLIDYYKTHTSGFFSFLGDHTSIIENFKASKQSQSNTPKEEQPTKERIKVGNIYCYAGEGSRYLQISVLTNEISKEKLNLIKEAIEKVINH